MLRDFDEDTSLQIGTLDLAIKEVEKNQNHCGILYRDGQSQIWLLHLGWNYRLYCNRPDRSYQWVTVNIDNITKKFLSIVCDRIRKAKPPIPYGLDASGIAFDPNTGELKIGAKGKGMTCASFILGVVNTYSIRLLAEEQWPENENVEWQMHTINKLSELEPVATAEQLNDIMADVGSRRFTPSEVVGASTDTPWPIGYSRAQELAAQLMLELRPAQPA